MEGNVGFFYLKRGLAFLQALYLNYFFAFGHPSPIACLRPYFSMQPNEYWYHINTKKVSNLFSILSQLKKSNMSHMLKYLFKALKFNEQLLEDIDHLSELSLRGYCQAQPKPQLSWAEWLYFQLIQPPPPPPGKVYFSAGANLVSKVKSCK